MLTPRALSLLKLAAGVARDALLLAGLLVFVVGVLFLLYTRWGRSKPLVKCMVLSALAHVMLLAYLPTVSLIRAVPRLHDEVFQVALHSTGLEGEGAEGDDAEEGDGFGQPWEGFSYQHVAQPRWQQAAKVPYVALPEPIRTIQSPPAPLPAAPTIGAVLTEVRQPPVEQLAASKPVQKLSSIAEAEAIQAPAPQRRDVPVTFGPPLPGPGRRGGEGGATGFQRITDTGSGLPESLLVPPSTPPLAEITATPDPPDGLARLPQQRPYATPAAPADPAGQGGTADSMAFGEESLGPSSAAALVRPSGTTDATNNAGPLGGWIATGSAGGAGGATSPSAPQATQGAAGERSQWGGGEGQGGTAPKANPASLGQGLSENRAELIGPPRLPGTRRTDDHAPAIPQSMPDVYRLRVSPQRSAIAQQKGATPETEAAVNLALKWLAQNQEPTGRWDPRQHGAGQERHVQGRNRQGAGIDADTGVTGLALLALLGAGNTHLQGEYRENVRRGLEYLMRIQAADGNLAGPATGYARMYCHAIALFALSEAYGMTGDSRLEPTVRRGVAYTLAAQNPTTGGWRYVPGDAGDTSMFGWQIIALKSAELAGITIPEKNRAAASRFLRSVASGRSYGLASYRPGEPPSRPMTAEALVCWQFLGMPREHPASKEAGNYLLEELPSVSGTPNLYYWYYATLGMFQLQGVYWEKWNAAMTKTLVALQRKDGPLAGSWDTNTVWGGYGGRVYTTSMATLCLEVYYRYLPLYAEAAGQERAR